MTMIRGIRQRREDASLSQLKLSMKSNIPQSSISNVENGHRPFSPNEAAKLAPHLDTTPEELVEISQAQVTLKIAAETVEKIHYGFADDESPDDFVALVNRLEQFGIKSQKPLVRKAARLSLSMINRAVDEVLGENVSIKEAATKDVDESNPDTGFGGRNAVGQRINKPVPDRNPAGLRKDDSTIDRDELGYRREKPVPDRDAFGKLPGHEPPPRDAFGRALEREEK